jgi:hypothetical protein
MIWAVFSSKAKPEGACMETASVQSAGKARPIADAHFDFAAETLGLRDPLKAFLKTPVRTLGVTSH